MRIAQALFRQVAPVIYPTHQVEPDSLTRFSPRHNRADHVPDALARCHGARIAQIDPEPPTRFAINHSRRPAPEPHAFPDHSDAPFLPAATQLSNEGCTSIPLSVLRRALPRRFVKPEMSLASMCAADDFVLLRAGAMG